MCQFFSGILKKDGKTLWDKNFDNHETLITKHKLTDSEDSKKWLRYEVTPIDNDIFNHDKKNWKIIIDENNISIWYERQKVFFDKKIMDSFKQCCKELFIIDKTEHFEQLMDGRFFVKNSTVKALGNSTVKARGNSTVDAWDNSTVDASDNSTVTALGNSTVDASDNSTVTALGNSTVKASDNSTVKALGNSTVKAWDNSTVDASDNSTVKAWDNSTVKALGNSTVEALDNSTVNIHNYSSNSKNNIHISEDAVLIDRKERIIYVGKKKVKY